MLIPMNRSRRSWLAPPVLAFLISSLAFASHLSGAANSSPAAKSVRSDMLVTTEWLAANLGKPEVVVLHVAGSRSGYDEGHIQGARFVATKEIATEREGIPSEVPPLADLTALVQRLGIDESRRIVVYDEEAGLLAARAAVSLFWMKSLVSKENPELRPVEELRDLFAKARIDPGELVVTYCRTGMQASHSYFTARYLGYDARLYDGSFIEWSARKEMPVEPGAPGSQPR